MKINDKLNQSALLDFHELDFLGSCCYSILALEKDAHWPLSWGN